MPSQKHALSERQQLLKRGAIRGVRRRLHGMVVVPNVGAGEHRARYLRHGGGVAALTSLDGAVSVVNDVGTPKAWSFEAHLPRNQDAPTHARFRR
ncbi:hypothetical protein OH76DRAFT_1408538 [Lentinus brumalis]|uniref:Uncharacterized protein n=1 Tax=Lentinus brumalis TaxID=2498619 RepID=A0A371CXC5_9APHY|nr:hypothetical protein OH76DRAFT_1408538 [Polyporus brumalis]